MTKDYLITTARPIGGRMRKAGDTVALTEREFEAEKGWGGIEPAPVKKAKGDAKTADAKTADAKTADADPKAN